MPPTGRLRQARLIRTVAAGGVHDGRQTANAYLRQIPDVVAVGGGVPIKIGDATIGAVGVSGAPGGEKDEVCANAGIAKVADQLK